MKKSIITIFAALFISQTAFASGYAGFIELDAGSPASDMSTSHLKSFELNPSNTLTTDIFLRNFTRTSDKEKIDKANLLLLKIMNSKEFKERYFCNDIYSNYFG